MATIAKLQAILSADTTRFKRGLSDADMRSKRFGSNLGSVMKKAGKAVAGFALGAAVALAAMTRAAMQSADQTAKTAQKLGILISELEALRLVASEGGIATNTLDMALQRMVRRVAEAAKGTGEAKDAIKQLGLDAKVLAASSPDEQFRMIAEAMNGVSNQGERIRLAFKFFDSEGVALVSILENIGMKMDEARAFNEKFNVSLTEVDAAKIEEANDAMGRVGLASRGLGNTLAVELSPLIVAVSNQLLDAGADGNSFGKAVKLGVSVASGAIDLIRKEVLRFQIVFNTVIAGLFSAASSAVNSLAGIDAVVSRSLDKIPGVTSRANQSLQGFAQTMAFAAEEGRDRVGALVDEFRNFETTASQIEKIQNASRERAQREQGGGMAALGIDPVEVSEDVASVQGSVEKLEVKTQDTFSSLDAISKRAAENMQDSFADFLFDPFEDGLKGMLRGFVDTLRRMMAEQASSSIFKSIAGSALGAIGSYYTGLGSVDNQVSGLISAKPDLFGSGSMGSFATGIANVPYDMDARIHKGEMVIPRQQAESMREEDSQEMPSVVYNIDARGADEGAVRRIESALMSLAGPGQIEKRVQNAQRRGSL